MARAASNKQFQKGSLQSTTYANMSDFVRAISAQYNLQYGYVIKDLDKITQKTAKEMAAAIREKSPVGKTGEYAKAGLFTGRKTKAAAEISRSTMTRNICLHICLNIPILQAEICTSFSRTDTLSLL